MEYLTVRGERKLRNSQEREAPSLRNREGVGGEYMRKGKRTIKLLLNYYRIPAERSEAQMTPDISLILDTDGASFYTITAYIC